MITMGCLTDEVILFMKFGITSKMVILVEIKFLVENGHFGRNLFEIDYFSTVHKNLIMKKFISTLEIELEEVL